MTDLNVPVSPGELLDKITILRIKSRRIHDVAKAANVRLELELLERLTGMVKAASLCGLGQTAPNPTLTTLRYFMDEYRAHIEEGRCPAGICHPAKAEVGA